MASWGHSKGILVIRAGPGTVLPERNAVTHTPLAPSLVPQRTPSGHNTQGGWEKEELERGKERREGTKRRKSE